MNVREPGPRVTVCVPNLNQRAFFPARFATFDAQTWRDFEVVACDNHSDDGSWEWLQERARMDPRVRIFQAPRKGMYANWNRCLAEARGELITFAPADDAMRPDCLAALVAALDAHPECDLADSQFAAIDEQGRDLPDPELETRERAFFGAWWERPHVRRAPHDVPVITRLTLVHRSATQVMIRRQFFERVGTFRNDLGSHADWEWHLRAAHVATKVFVPAPLTHWRRWSGQATKDDYLATIDYCAKRRRMIALARETLRARGLPGADTFTTGELELEIDREEAMARWHHARQPLAALAGLAARPAAAAALLRQRLTGESAAVARVRRLRALLRRHGLADAIQPA